MFGPSAAASGQGARLRGGVWRTPDNEGRSREPRVRMHGSSSSAFAQGGEAAGQAHACTYSIASEAERFEGLQKPTRLAKVHVVPGRTLGAVAALQVQDDLLDSSFDGRR